MSHEQDQPTFERPISALKLNDRALTGAPALIAYALIDASREPGQFVTGPELTSIVHEASEDKGMVDNRARGNMKMSRLFLKKREWVL